MGRSVFLLVPLQKTSHFQMTDLSCKYFYGRLVRQQMVHNTTAKVFRLAATPGANRVYVD